VAQATRQANAEALEKTAVVVRECEARLGAMRDALAESEAGRSRLSEEVVALRAKLVALEAEKASAVEEVKVKLYEKAQRQFEEGNREYQRVLRELKESKNQCERACDDAAVVRAQAAAAGRALEEAEATRRALVFELDGIKASIARVLSLTTGAAPREDVEGSLRDHEAFLCSQSKLIADLEAALGSSAAAAEEAGRRLRTEAAARESAEEAQAAARALHSASQQQVAALEAERATNLALIARLVTSQDKFEGELERLREDLRASNDRCVSLRAMNEELLGMLEGGAQAV
jgi:chromosome segregation ATPase